MIPCQTEPANALSLEASAGSNLRGDLATGHPDYRGSQIFSASPCRDIPERIFWCLIGSRSDVAPLRIARSATFVWIEEPRQGVRRSQRSPVRTSPSIENSPVPLRVFCSYAHEDEPMRDRLEQQLAALKRRKLISVWHDGTSLPGLSGERRLSGNSMTLTLFCC